MLVPSRDKRRREIGIRLALGAQPREIRGLFVRRGLVVVASAWRSASPGLQASPD
jgi:ABC-type lipoprotein release transport system permease subunit